jgi:ornithine cyclodeaminase/alanine dehydrogenase-like protein (mu-crystallin family)
MSEEQSAALITHEIAYTAVREALIAAAGGQATVFPAVIGHGGDPQNTFTIKSGSSPQFAGVKIGSYWPGNVDIPRHGTTVLLLDQLTGRVAAVVEAGLVNAYRTAAADAVAADALARPDATVLTIVGTGHQALHECLALSRIRPLEAIHVVARTPEHGERFCTALAERGLPGRVTRAEEACRAADVIVTATTARAPLFEAGWVSPGTHVASMGSDQRGKQELPTDLLANARLFCDLPGQSVAIGEFQHIASLVADGTLAPTAIGEVLAGTAAGRRSPDDVTVFDSSGIALQDLAVATALLDAHNGSTREGQG